MLQDQEDKTPNLEAIDNAFKNIEQNYYAEKKYKTKKNALEFFFNFILLSILFFVFKLLNKGWDWTFIILSIYAYIGLFDDLQDFLNQKLKKYLHTENNFTKKIDFVISRMPYPTLNKIKNWNDDNSKSTFIENLNLLEYIKKKIYSDEFFFKKGKLVLKEFKEDSAFGMIYIKEIYHLSILKDEINKDIYKIIHLLGEKENELCFVIQNNFKKFEIELSKIKKLPKRANYFDDISCFINGFKNFNFSNIELYRKLDSFNNYEFKDIFYDIDRRRVRHTSVAAILRHKNSYQNAKLFFDSIKMDEVQFSLYPINSYFTNLKNFLIQFENYLNKYNIKLETPKYIPPPVTIKRTYINNEPKQKTTPTTSIEKETTDKENLNVKNVPSVTNIKTVTNKNNTNNVSDNSTEQNAKIGLLGELFILNYEKQKLNHLPLYANAIEHTSQVKGDAIGYDIKSFSEDGESIFIEVKTTVGDLYSNFFITKKEMEILKSNSNYYVYRVFEFDEKVERGELKIYKTINHLNEDFEILPVSYSVKPNI
jgi:Domain of unknown function (DUF3883)